MSRDQLERLIVLIKHSGITYEEAVKRLAVGLNSEEDEGGVKPDHGVVVWVQRNTHRKESYLL